MRNIAIVIEEMKPYIDNAEVLEHFDEILDDAYWKAPEFHYILWNELGGVLNHYYPIPLKNENEVKIVSIFTTMTEEEVREKFCEKVEA